MYKSPLAPEKQNKLNFPPEFVWRLEGNDFKSSNSQSGPVETGGEICAHFQYIHHIVPNEGGGALCVEMGFTWTFPRNQDATVKLKSELISIKF